MISQIIDQQLENDLEQLASLKQAEDRPYILDEETVSRIIKLYTEAADHVWWYQQQLNRWRKEKLTVKQLQEISRLDQQVQQVKNCHSDILALADHFKDNTIEQILGKSDMELALDVLSGKLQPPF